MLENFIDVSFPAVILCTFLLFGLIYIVIDHFESKELGKTNFEMEQNYNLEQKIETERLQKEFDEKEKLEQFIDRLYVLKEELNKILFDIYNLNIIHSSYRKIMSVATIYNLLDTKICCELEGKDGAYNMCNTETYRNQMLIKVDEILENVEIIRDINFALYEMLKNTNEILESILLCNYIENIQLDKIFEDINTIKFFEEIEYIKNCKDSFIKEISDMLKRDNVK